MEPVPYNVWLEGVKKWEEAIAWLEEVKKWEEGVGQSTPEEAIAWWREVGQKNCSFCDHYMIFPKYHHPVRGSCGECPLFTGDSFRRIRCAKEWLAIGHEFERRYKSIFSNNPKEKEEAMRAFFEVFRRESKKLLERIKALPHTEE